MDLRIRLSAASGDGSFTMHSGDCDFFSLVVECFIPPSTHLLAVVDNLQLDIFQYRQCFYFRYAKRLMSLGKLDEKQHLGVADKAGYKLYAFSVTRPPR